MKILLAQQNDLGQWKRVCFFSATQKGQLNGLNHKWSGTLESFFAGAAAKRFAAEPAAVDVDFQFGSRRYRASRCFDR